MSSSLATDTASPPAGRAVRPVLPVDALLACLRGSWLDPAAPLFRNERAIYRLAELALHHRVANAVFLRARHALDPTHPAYLRLQREYVDGVARHLRTLSDLNELGPVLTGADIPWMVIKGPVLAETLYPSPDLRAYDDLDVVVPPSRFADAVSALESAGRAVADRNWSVLLDQGRAQLHVVLRLGTVTDLHWHLLNRELVRASFEISTDELFERGRHVTVGTQEILTLDPEDTLAHLCIHAGLDGGHRLRPLQDITLAAAAGLDWERFVNRARRWRARLLIATMLERAVLHLDADVPAPVLRQLQTSALVARAGRRLQRAWSPERITDPTPSAGALLVRGLRDNGRSTVATLARKALARRNLGEWKNLTLGRRDDPPEVPGAGPMGPLHESGDDATKAAYFEGVMSSSALGDVVDGPVMLVCSPGGHLAQLYQLRPWWGALERTWVTFDKPDCRSLLAGETVEWAYHPTTRNLPNLLRNTRLAWRLLRRDRPALVVSTGAGVALPFFVFARLFGIPSAYIEVYDRIDIPSLTGRLCYRFSDVFVLQWDEQRKAYPKGTIIGRLL